MATEAPLPNATISKAYIDAHLDSAPTQPVLEDTASSSLFKPNVFHPKTQQRPSNPFITPATCTLHSFPSFEPTRFATYPSTHLLLPLRKDILHRAVIYEGDMTRQGTASTKWRDEVHGSGRKIRPQKGTGKARLGDKKSPMLRGGGVAFGPKPRDFSTKLPRKLYDQAWRTALSWRYKKGELIVLDGDAEIRDVHENSAERWMRDMLLHNHMGHPDGRTLFVTLERREALFDVLGGKSGNRDARALDVTDVDVKDLLELGRVVVERGALEWMFEEHETDLGPDQKFGAWDALVTGQQEAGEQGQEVETRI